MAVGGPSLLGYAAHCVKRRRRLHSDSGRCRAVLGLNEKSERCNVQRHLVNSCCSHGSGDS